MPWRRWSIAKRLLAANLVFVLLMTAGLAALLVSDARSRSVEQTRERLLAIASTLADSPFVAAAATGPEPAAALQPYALAVMRDAEVDFITIMDPQGVRWTHPRPEEIGRPYVGSIAEAQAGNTHVETSAGTLGPSVRVIMPVKDSTGAVLGMVAAGVTLNNVQLLVAARIPTVLGFTAALLLAGFLLAWSLGRYLNKVTFGRGPEELAQLFSYYESVLHSVREGLLLMDTRGRLVLYNDHAARLLDLDVPGREASGTDLPGKTGGADASGKEGGVDPAALHLPDSLQALLHSGRAATDEVHLAGGRLLVVSQRPATAPGHTTPAGTVATLRDHTELTALAGRLSSTETLVEALRSQTHEHANRLHAIISLIELDRPREALEFATAERAENLHLGGDFLHGIDEPFLAALLLGKRAQADERGVRLELSSTGTLPKDTLDARELVTLVGNLVDNAMDAAAHNPNPTVWVDLLVADGALTVTVADNGPGLPTTDLDVLGRIGTTAKDSVAPGGRGYGMALIRRAASALGGTISGENDGGAVMTAVVPIPQAGGGAP